MTRTLVLTSVLVLAATGAAHAQPCLALSDGAGNTTVSCPDGRSGLLRTDPAGIVSGTIGDMPYQGTTSGVGPVGAASGAPSTSLLALPPPPSSAAPPPPPPDPPSLSLTDLTRLQREYQAEQESFRARRLAAERAKKALPAAP